MSWCKLEDTFCDDVKIMKLAQNLGVEDENIVFGLLARLWSWSIRHCPNGVLGQLETDVIETIIRWKGAPKQFINACIEHGFIDQHNDVFLIHGWKKRTGSYADTLRKRAQRSPKTTKSKKTNCPKNVPGQSHDSPVPDKIRKEEIRIDKRRKDKKENYRENILDVFLHYQTYHPDRHKNPNSRLTEWTKIRDRLQEGKSVEDLKLAIDGCHRSDFHQGNNDDGAIYDSLELIVRDSSKVERFKALATQPKGPGKFKSELAAAAMRFSSRGHDDDIIAAPLLMRGELNA